MNGVLGLGELVALSATDPTVRRYGQLIRESGLRLQQLLQALLDLAQLSPRTPPDPRSCELTELLAGVAACNAGALQRHGLVLATRADPAVPRLLRVDRPRLAFLLHMLVRDAIERSAGPGALSLCATAHDGGISVSVRREETGPAPAAASPARDGTTWDGGVADRMLGEIGGRQLDGGGADRILWLPGG